MLLMLFLPLSAPVVAQEAPVAAEGTQVGTEQTPAAAANAEELRKESQNPIASLISVPIQENWNFGIGPSDRTQNVMNIQPVIPISLSTNWNLVTRWIIPVVYQPLPVAQPPGPPAQQTGVYGLGDMNPSFFLSPKKSKVIWGAGLTAVLPTATNTTYLGQGKLSLGPTVVVLVQPSHFTIGLLVNNYWSVAGHSNFTPEGAVNKPAVNQFLLQWFINYNMNKGWYLKTAPINTANWRAPDNSGTWIVPLGGGVGRVMKVGFQPVNISAEFYGNAVHPAGTSPWTMRLSFTLLFPRLSQDQKKELLEKALKQMEQEPSQK